VRRVKRSAEIVACNSLVLSARFDS
jgi:hypothetical protein